MVLGFRAQSNGYRATLADLDNDYMKVDVTYPRDIPEAFRFMDELKLDEAGNEEQARSSTHLAFVQGNDKKEMACFDCGMLMYITTNSPTVQRASQILKVQGFKPNT